MPFPRKLRVSGKKKAKPPTKLKVVKSLRQKLGFKGTTHR